MKIILKILLIIIAVLVLACLISFWLSYNWLTVSKFTVTDDKISGSFRIVLISDLHEHRFGGGNEKLAEKIREQSPDLIIIDGDMIITRGLGSNLKMLPRFNNPPEIAVVDVKGEKRE